MHSQERKNNIKLGYQRWILELKSDPEKYLEHRKKIAESRKRTEAIRSANVKETWKRKLLEADFETLSLEAKRSRCIAEQKGACNKCGLSKWLGHDIILELDHKDGNHANRSRENYEAVCPNCHSITPTWRGRNKRSVKKVTDAEAIAALKTSPSIRQALIKVGLTPKGGNYKRFSLLLKSI